MKRKTSKKVMVMVFVTAVMVMVCMVSPVMSQESAGEVIDGVYFPIGARSFADSVVSYTPGSGVEPPHDMPASALGVPDYIDETGYVSLGHGGSLTVQFIDNVLVDQDEVENGNDLYIYEIGPAVEPFEVFISKDGANWTFVGEVAGQPTGIDIAPYVETGVEYRFVKLVDSDARMSSSPWAGADIDAIGAIGSIGSTISITTNKFKYFPRDMTSISLNLINPTEDNVTYQWYWVVPQFNVSVPVMPAPIPAGYNDTLDFNLTIPDWGPTPFGNLFYVQLLDASGEILDADVTWWAYSPSGVAMPVAEIDIEKEIKKIIGGIEWPS